MHRYAINDGDDVLENVNMAEDWRRKDAKDKASGEYSTIYTHGCMQPTQ